MNFVMGIQAFLISFYLDMRPDLIRDQISSLKSKACFGDAECLVGSERNRAKYLYVQHQLNIFLSICWCSSVHFPFLINIYILLLRAVMSQRCSRESKLILQPLYVLQKMAVFIGSICP